MQKVIAVLAALAGVAFGPAAPPWAVSELHEDGTGFVTGNDVRAALGWDDATLRAEAASLEFVAESESVTGISWSCVHAGTAEVLPQRTDLVVTESRAITSRPRTMWWGTVAGFRLQGFDGRGASSAVPEGPAPGSCPAGPWSLVEGSMQTVETTGDPVLMVRHDGAQHPVPVG
ncbi:hypothetical protein GMA12_07520 [Kocuria sediminis]|uniref:Uncharacterized protein n=1 Tax=Kocuria sediminis TaxID=1038857 RepID=A0A6N8GL63_9MICC|nr:hypothetical protein [Kocuria sediminis]MUN62990.1 hypothetical protein [Kocuria sediminis]